LGGRLAKSRCQNEQVGIPATYHDHSFGWPFDPLPPWLDGVCPPLPPFLCIPEAVKPPARTTLIYGFWH
jgi:hypothetical protein